MRRDKSARDAAIVARFAAGGSLREIAVQFGISNQLVWHVVARDAPTLSRTRPSPTILERFMSKVDRSGVCWLWMGGMTSGYGQFFMNGRARRANRVSWELYNGPIPEGMMVCHNCPGGDNPRCVNPAHLWLGSARDNSCDSYLKGRQTYNAGARATHCRRGHEMSGSNVYLPPKGRRECHTCRRNYRLAAKSASHARHAMTSLLSAVGQPDYFNTRIP